jgi:hypothetical protein
MPLTVSHACTVRPTCLIVTAAWTVVRVTRPVAGGLVCDISRDTRGSGGPRRWQIRLSYNLAALALVAELVDAQG